MESKEPMHDNQSLEMFEDIKVAELVSALLIYSKELENQVVMLRKEVNSLSDTAGPKPYEDLYSDVFQVFDHYPAYEKYQEYIEVLTQ